MATKVIVAWDSEYQQVDPEGLGRPNPLTFKGASKRRGHMTREQRARQAFNDVLAYSVCVLNPETGETVSDALIASTPSDDGLTVYADWRKRLTLFGLVAPALAMGVGAGVIPADPKGGYQVIFVAHFTAADFPALRDFEQLSQHRKRYFHAIRKTYVTLDRPLKRTVRIPGIGHRVPVSVRMSDTILWAPATHRSIAALGDAIGLPKITLPKGAISNMRGLAASDPELFRDYAIRDAEVAAQYAHRFLKSCETTFGLGPRVPVTASGAGVRFFKNKLEESGFALEDLTGDDPDGGTDGYASDVIRIAAECFHGGRNETFWIGPTPKGTPLYDLDLGGCYPSCMAHIRMPDFESREFTTDLDRLAVINEELTFARVNFEFPPDVRFPVLPVRGDDASGLFFPRSGVSWCTGPELVAARNLGARITVEHGVAVPWVSDFKPFLAVLKDLQAIRSREKNAGRKGSVDERLAKEMANSLYGQTARAVAGLRIHGKPVKGFDLYDGSRPDLPAGSVTSAPCAAYITGLARATVGELINTTPPDATVVSVTTDGFLSSVPLEEIDQSGPLMQAFTAGRHAIDPDEPALEEKHRAERALSLRTRGVLSIAGDRSRPPLFARAGNRMDEDDLTAMAETVIDGIDRDWAENDYWLERTVERQYGDKVKRSRLTSIAEQWALRGGDLTRKTLEVSVALEFDHKRRILDPVEDWRGVFGAPTVAWETIADATSEREMFKQWRHDQQRVLKTKTDLEDFGRFKTGLKPRGTRGRNAKLPGQIDALRWASAHGLHGLPDIEKGRADLANGRWNAGSIAEALTRIGVPTTRQQIQHRIDRNKAPETTEPDPETLEKLKAEIAATEAEMRRKQSAHLGLIDKSASPKGVCKPAEIPEQKQQVNGHIHKVPKFSYKGWDIWALSAAPSMKEVRAAATLLSIGRVKFDMAVRAFTKRHGTDAPQDPVIAAIYAVAVAAFGEENPDGPKLVAELIAIERTGQ